jgi:hypothetical protein
LRETPAVTDLSTNTALVEAMRNVSVEDTPARRALLFQLLLESTLIAATPVAGPETTYVTGIGETLSFITTSDDDGTILPLFTSEATLLDWIPAGTGYAALPASALFEMALNGGNAKVVLDPGSPTWGWITRSEIEALARGRLPIGGSGEAPVRTEVVGAATSVRYGLPAVPPTESALSSLRAAAALDPRVAEVYVYLMQQGELPAEMVVAVCIDGDDATRDAIRARFIANATESNEECRRFAYLTPWPDLLQSLRTGAGIRVA